MISLATYFRYLEAISSCALSGNKLAIETSKKLDKAKNTDEKILIVNEFIDKHVEKK